jgi:hypothetical protein
LRADAASGGVSIFWLSTIRAPVALLIGGAVVIGVGISALLSRTRLGLDTRGSDHEMRIWRGESASNSGACALINGGLLSGSSLAASCRHAELPPFVSVDPNMGTAVARQQPFIALVLVSGSSLVSLAIDVRLVFWAVGGGEGSGALHTFSPILLAPDDLPVLGAASILRVRATSFAHA